MAIDATIGGASANSYCTLAEANTYFTARLYSSDWTSATDPDKEAALLWAARLLDEYFNWDGDEAEPDTQAMRWPRYGAYDIDQYPIDGDVIPTTLKNAQAELSIWLIQTNRTAETGTDGFSNIRVGPIGLTVDKSDRTPVIPDHVANMLTPIGNRRSQGGVVDVVRA